MDSFEFNKIAGAVLFAALVIFGTKTMSDIIFASHAPEKPGFVVAVATEAGGTAPAAKAEPAVPLAELLKAASIEAGQRVAKKCAACHSFGKGGANKVGPHLYDIVGRTLGAVDGFAYSGALRQMGGDWGYDALDAFIKKPKSWLPGTKMAFAGIRKPEQRANLIAYLRSLSEAPKPLP